MPTAAGRSDASSTTRSRARTIVRAARTPRRSPSRRSRRRTRTIRRDRTRSSAGPDFSVAQKHERRTSHRRPALVTAYPSLVTKLGDDVALFVVLAVAALDAEQAAALADERHHQRLLPPRLQQHLGILDDHLVEHLVALAREALDDPHVPGVEDAAAREPGRRLEADRLDHERVAFPVAERMAGVLRLQDLPRVELAAVRRDDAEIRITAAAVAAAAVDQRDVFLGVEDTARRTLTRNAHRLARHDRVIAVRPHVEVDDLVPVLRPVDRPVGPEARCRFELEVDRLIPRRAAAVELRRRAAAVAVAPDEELVRDPPHASQIGLAVREPRRRRVRIEHRRLLIAAEPRQR